MKISIRPEKMSCQQVVELVTAYIDRSLPRRVLKAIDRHLEHCDECIEYIAEMRRVPALSKALATDVAVPETMIAILTAAFLEANPERPEQR